MMRTHIRTILLIALLAPARSACADAPPALRLEMVARGLKQPVYLTHDGTARRYIVEQQGTIRVIENGKLVKQPYLDIVKRVLSGGECGLLSVAFHPKFASNGFLYVNYTAIKPTLKTVISRFKADSGQLRVDPGSEKILLLIEQPFSNHNGGQINFGPDGFLYIGMGDGGAGGDPHNNGQNTDTLLGKMLRIDVDVPVPGKPSKADKTYEVPDDNPFVGRKRYRPEIWATGLRNPWRFTFDRETGDCYTGDIGQNLYEEIDLIVKGGNYGWRVREGLHAFGRGARREGLIDPIAEYGRDKGQSVTGGYVYRGKSIEPLVGWYLYADYATGRFWGLRQKNGEATDVGEIDMTYKDATGKERVTLNRIQPASFGEDVDGELYVCDHNGVLYRIMEK